MLAVLHYISANQPYATIVNNVYNTQSKDIERKLFKEMTMDAVKDRQVRIELLTKKEVASFWRVTTRTIDRLISQGKIPFVKLPGGRSIRFRATDLEKMVQESRG